MEKRLFKVYYRKNPGFVCNKGITIEQVTGEVDFAHVRDMRSEDLEGVFYGMQGEVWSPNGEANELIRSKGLHHTSISVGDVVHDVTAGIYWQVDMCGWKEILH